MKITVEHDDGKKEVFQHVTDAYLAVRSVELAKGKKSMASIEQTKSYSWGANVRELVKEVAQSLIELQDWLRGNSPK